MGYRALQTLISWYVLNGYVNIEIPKIPDIQKILIFLGHERSSTINKNKILSLTNLGLVFSYLIDSELEIFFLNNLKDFLKNIAHFQNCLKEYRCPILISKTNTIFTILGIRSYNDNNENENVNIFPSLLILNHSYYGVNSYFHVKKAGICKWIPLNEFLSHGEDSEIMIIKTIKCI
jgi:hypothetical protein